MSQENKINRCAWCGTDAMYQLYHDAQWGVPCFDDQELFEMLCLEGMQAGLSWITVLRKRQAFYDCFDQFNPCLIAYYDDKKVEALMNNAAIIRHRQKINAIIANAQAYLKITKNQSFSDYLWGIAKLHQAQTPLINFPKTLTDVPVSTPASVAMSKQLKKDGFKFVGPTTCYAFMQACGMVDDHMSDCDFKSVQK